MRRVWLVALTAILAITSCASPSAPPASTAPSGGAPAPAAAPAAPKRITIALARPPREPRAGGCPPRPGGPPRRTEAHHHCPRPRSRRAGARVRRRVEQRCWRCARHGARLPGADRRQRRSHPACRLLGDLGG